MKLESAKRYNLKHASDVTPGSAILAHLVAEWQADHALSADGEFGPATRAAFARAHAVMTPAPIVLPAPMGGAGPTIKLVDWIPGLTIDDIEERWAAMAALDIKYALGSGGRDPRAADPRTTGKRGFGLDCTGAVCHAFGLDRYQPNMKAYGGWCSSDGIYEDATGRQELWELLDRPVRGAALVLPSIDFDSDGDRERIGHGAFVRSAPAAWTSSSKYADVEIWDCAGSNSTRPGAVGDVWRHQANYFDGKETFRGKTKASWGTISVWCKAIGRP